MSNYTTGEMAKLCGVSVRTVQFYDTKGLLIPSSLTEGGRRLYSEDDLKEMRRICLLKSLGLSLEAIKGALESKHAEQILLLLLDEQEKQLAKELTEKEKQKKAIDLIRHMLKDGQTLSAESITDIDHMMENKKKLSKLHRNMLLSAMPAGLIEWGTIIYWIATGIWWPFVAGLPIVIFICSYISLTYYRKTAYICPACGKLFRPTFKEVFFARHTFRTRKLTCTDCGVKDWCVETYSEE